MRASAASDYNLQKCCSVSAAAVYIFHLNGSKLQISALKKILGAPGEKKKERFPNSDHDSGSQLICSLPLEADRLSICARALR